MSLCPLTEAHILQARVARLLEQAKRPQEAHDADIMARHIEQIAAAEDAAEDARLASEEAEIAAWEARDGRQFDAWAKTASVGEIEQRMGVL